jgi:hypothetical protein
VMLSARAPGFSSSVSESTPVVASRSRAMCAV